MTKTKLFSFLLMLLAVSAFAQQKQVETSIDSTKIKIGSQFHLTLKTTVDTAANVGFPEGKNFGQLEVLESYPTDTVKKGALYELIKKYGLTQFDSGRYVIPSLPVIIDNEPYQTDSLSIEVANVKVDTLKQKMYDIKDIATAESKMSWWWLYVLLGLAALGVAGYFVYRYLKNRKVAPKEAPVVFSSPIEKATVKLRDLEKKDLLQRGAIKDYYSELTDIARTYIEEAIHVPAMESTTSELIEAMRAAVSRKRMALTRETFEELEKVLRTADMVKFAKSKPLDFEVAEDRMKIEKTIVVIDKSIPEEKEEDEEHTLAWLEKQRQKEAKRKKNIIIGSSIGVVVLLIAGFLVFKGVGFIKDNFSPTNQLLKAEWVKSQYGSPGVIIETPKVLKRADVDKTIPKEAIAVVKEMQMFTYGMQFSNFYVAVSTLSYKKPTDVKLDMLFDDMSKQWEALKAKDILVKQESFTTPDGAEGLRAYGSMSMPNPLGDGGVKYDYEILYFKQANGIQQVVMMYPATDEDAPKIVDRIKNSVEFRKQN
ncbi:BatD family protein [Flavobacterium sp. C4GT6]|uniref:BatD family protein n=1 Tax=Flavobacterium sp. C4GT6 TaxID=3103818 RepID=UPI002ED6280E